MTGRAYMEEVLAEIRQELSELLDIQVNAQKQKTSVLHASFLKPTKKCVMKMKQRKNHVHVKMLFIEGSLL